jgi:intracellular sulfur oxidation DsrE/DsrF family protein
MKRHDSLSDEQINAFVDGELDASEQERVFKLTEQDLELDKRICQQRKLKEMVRHAYDGPPGPHKSRQVGIRGRWWLGGRAAAALLLISGFIAGVLLSDAMPRIGAAGDKVDGVKPLAQQGPANYLLHLTQSDAESMAQALRSAEQYLRAADASESVQVEIVANEGGLDLLRSDVTPFAARVHDLANRGVLFFACTKAIERLEERGVDVRLLPEANRNYSALDRVVVRLEDGWKYVKL